MNSLRRGLHPLNTAPLFRCFNRLIGTENRCRVLCADFIRARPGDHILDAGCGVADILDYLPEGVSYAGFDSHLPYIEYNRRRFKGRGTFLCEDISTGSCQEARSWDLFLGIGILHHLDDEKALSLLQRAKSALKPGGRFVSADGCFAGTQSVMARMVLKCDRGKFVRRQTEYEALARRVFSDVLSTVLEGTLRIPHTLLVMECAA